MVWVTTLGFVIFARLLVGIERCIKTSHVQKLDNNGKRQFCILIAFLRYSIVLTTLYGDMLREIMK